MDDLIRRFDAIMAVQNHFNGHGFAGYQDGQEMLDGIMALPSAEPESIYCKDCKWWDRESEDSPMGYCHACKHGHYSRHWEISIRRTYEEDFFCADAEPKEEGDEDD